MQKVEIKYTCDICGAGSDDCIAVNYPVKFLTEQTEGRPVAPYIYYEKLDVCPNCLNQIIRLSATGAQGCNTYRII